jgi:hypothetical protein
MNKDIHNFITIHRFKNGRIKIKHDISNESNIYKTLYEFGFRQSKLDGKRIYYHRKKGKIKLVSIEKIRKRFYQFLIAGKYKNLPKDISKDDILNWFLSKNPIRQNGLLEYHLKGELSDFEAHQLIMDTNLEYKAQFKINQLLSKLRNLNFEKSVDEEGSFCEGNELYFKQVVEDEFLVLNHYNKNRILNSGFDLWKAKFKNKKMVGIEPPISLESIKPSFEIVNDWRLIDQYLY